jgi:hypothetical protein
MSESLQEDWKKVEAMVLDRFGEKLDEQTILFIIGLQELGKNNSNYKKEEKLFLGLDDDGWPHFKNIKKLPNNPGEPQQNLLKQAIITYFNL